MVMFQTAIVSCKGGRRINQDFGDFVVTEQGGCWVIADGLGGHQSGEVASQTAVVELINYYKVQHKLQPKILLAEGIERSQSKISELQSANLLLKTMRTTIVALCCNGNSASWAHVGDSRLYYFRNNSIKNRTKDHSVCQALVNAGEINQESIRNHEDRNRLYRVLGTEKEVKATTLKKEILIQKGDAFLLCTDGFWELILEADMEETLKTSNNESEWLEKMVKIVETRMSVNHDNFSAISVFVS